MMAIYHEKKGKDGKKKKRAGPLDTLEQVRQWNIDHPIIRSYPKSVEEHINN
jgi:hypothetical protein